ncbi:MAG: hypothetical protein Q9180_001610 [Flavoplaca navasiana]
MASLRLGNREELTYELSSPWVQLEGKSDDEPDLPSHFPSMNFSWSSGKAE